MVGVPVLPNLPAGADRFLFQFALAVIHACCFISLKDVVCAPDLSLLIPGIRNGGRLRNTDLKVSISDACGYVGLLALLNLI
jgi:hypothetical protein